MVGPDYQEPKKDITSHWLNTTARVKEDPLQDADWWKTFHDDTLTALIYQGYQNNLTIQMAAMKVLQARAQLAASVGELYPQQQAMLGNYTYYRIGGGSLQSLLPPDFETAQLGFTANWELDFWGKYRRAIQANDAAFLASIAAYDNAMVTLLADIASTYIGIRTTEQLIKVTKANIQIQRMSLQIAEARYKAGETSLLDVEQASTELFETESTLPGEISQLQRQKDTLGVLLGITPDQVDPLLGKKKGIPHAPPQVLVGIPKETLAQRPDVHQARLEAMGQAAGIGAIKANLFPSFSLSGTFVFAANTIARNSLDQLFNWSNRTITAGPSFTWPLFNYGQITNAVRAQDAVYQEALFNYLNVVLSAQQEVQDNITQYIESQKAMRYLTKANQSAVESTKLALIRYKEGESDYTTVLDVERQQLRVQTSLTNATGDVSSSLVALYRALGGGWQIRDSNDIVPLNIQCEMAKRTNWGSLLQPQNHLPPKSMWQQIKEIYLPAW